MSPSNNAMKGGDGAAEHAISVFGPAGAQHAGTGNLIAMNPTAGGARRRTRGKKSAKRNSSYFWRKGGRKSMKNRRKRGGGILSSIVLPASFYGLSEYVRRSKILSKK